MCFLTPWHFKHLLPSFTHSQGQRALVSEKLSPMPYVGSFHGYACCLAAEADKEAYDIRRDSLKLLVKQHQAR